MKRVDPVALVADLEHRPPAIGAQADQDRASVAVAAIAKRVRDQVRDHDLELALISTYDQGRLGPVEAHHRATFASELAAVADRDRDDRAKVDPLARRAIAIGLDPRQRHQFLDQLQHAPGFAADGGPEALAKRGVELAVFGQRLGITNHRCQWGAQFVAGIGDEVGAHPLGRSRRRHVRQPHQLQRPRQWRDHDPPRPVGAVEPDQFALPGGGIGGAEDQLERIGVADREANVIAFGARPNRFRGAVDRHHPTAIDDQARILRRIEQGAGEGGDVGH